MNVLICANLKKDKSREIVLQVSRILNQNNITVFLDENYKTIVNQSYIVYGKEEEMLSQCDMLITVGGDGTILKWGRKAAACNKPLLGVNTGRLGFMATLECDELIKLSKLKDKDYTISKRMLLNITLSNGENYLAVNDIVFSKTRYSKLPEFCVCAGDFEVTKIRADGIIFSTPTGSTAYSLSAGGPIISPDANCIEFTPLCAHSLFGRPMIFADDTEITVSFSAYENSGVIISVDGDDDIDFAEGETATIRKSELSLELIDINGGSFYNSVHNKLMRSLK